MSTAARAPVGIDLPNSVYAAGHARAFLRAQLRELSSTGLADAELLISEIVTNAVRHGKPPIRLDITFDGTITRFGVHDAGATFTVITPPAIAPHILLRHAGGRGLLITAAVAAHWGIIADSRAAGKTVWFALDD